MSGSSVAWTVIYTGVACSLVAITILNRYQRDVSPTRASVLYTLEPVFAAAMAAAFVGEVMTWRVYVGGAIILVGNVACEAFKGKGEDAAAHQSPEPSAKDRD